MSAGEFAGTSNTCQIVDARDKDAHWSDRPRLAVVAGTGI